MLPADAKLAASAESVRVHLFSPHRRAMLASTSRTRILLARWHKVAALPRWAGRSTCSCVWGFTRGP